MRSRKSRCQIGFSMKERILARIMILVLTVSMIPYQTFAADPAVVKTVKSTEDIRTKYEVDYGTTLEKIGLPSSLSAVIETTRLSDGNTDEEPESTEETVQEDIRWEGKYDGNSAGKYKLEARFEDKDLVYKDMPVVTVTVREPESEPEDEPVQSEPEDKPDQSEKEDEQAQSGYVDKADQPEEEEKEDQPEDKAAQSEKEEKANQPNEKDKADQPEKEDKAAQSENADEAGQSRSTDEEDKPETEAVKDLEQNADSNVRMKKTEKRFADVSVDEPFADAPVDEPSGDSNSSTTPEEQAEIYYGENGTARTFTVTLTDDKHNTAPNDVTCAGGNIGYNINVIFHSAARYKYDENESTFMFSEWKNIRIYLKLPENVRFTEIKTQGVADHFTQIDSENNLWEIVLNRDHRDATNNNIIDLDIDTRIEGNGELPDGTVLGEAEVTFSADFDVRINEDGTVKQYSKTVLDSTDKIILSTPDEWTLTKSSLVPNSYTIDENTDPASVTVHYLIQYGLDVNGVPADDDNVYKSPGRVPFKNDIKLTDTPTLTLQNGTKLVETSMTVTPVRTGYVYKDGSSADEGGKPKAITVQRDMETVLPYAVVGSNTKGVAASAPAYSEYNVDVVYPYDEFEVWYFENVSEDDARAKAENKAKIRYQLAGQDTGKDTPESSAETTVSGYIPPANIKIEKYIVDYDSDSRNLYTAAKGFVTGPATFEVYESDGTKPAVLWYKDASDNNKFKKIPSGNIVTVDPAQAKSESNGNEGWIDFYLNAGTYVIKETGRPAYTDAQGSAEKTITANKDGAVNVSFENKEKLGEIRLGVIKKDKFSDSTQLAGAKFEISDESGKKQTVTTKDSGAVYAKIDLGHVYTITETEAPAEYYKDAQPQTIETLDWRVVMENGSFKIVKGDGTEVKEEDLVFTFEDTPYQYITANVVDKYYNKREYELTGLKYELEGAEIALYQNNGDGTYTYVTTGVTDKNGQVSFGKLEFSADGFIAIEISIPDREEYKHMVPAEGDYLQKTNGSCPTALTQEEVDALSRTVLTSETDPKYTGEIDNVLPWTQIRVRKYDEDNQSNLDGADFTLYKQVLPENQDGGELAFDAANCTVAGRYTSGTLIQDGQAKKGEFQTDILEIADNIVYWLVETRAPEGYAIKESENYVLFANEGTNYTNKSNGGKSTKVFENGLRKNTINDYEAENEKENGPEALNNRAYIVFTKWMQKEETAGKQDLALDDFRMMSNAVFELYAVNTYDHNKVYLLDTITTGNENLVEDGNTTGYGVSHALDAWEIFDEIERKFPDQREHIITYKSAPDSGYDVDYPYVVGPDGKPIEDAAGNRTKIKGTFVLNAALVEKSCSSKYNLDLHDHNLQIMFIPSSMSLGNDKYAVANLENSSAGFCDEAEDIRNDYTKNSPSSVAILDYLASNNSVVLRHFGYDPKQTGDELQYEDLEALRSSSPSLFISRRVSFSLERYNEDSSIWEYWSPTENKKIDNAENFSTDGNGFSFEEGLEPGEYRAVMTKPAEGYENLYPDEDSAFHFTVAVSDKSQVFTTYSPAKPPRVRMIIDKEVDFGVVRARDYSFSFTLEDSKSNKMPAETGKDAATGTLKDDGTIEKTQAVFDDLTQGETYYLKENPKEGYLIKEVKVDGQTCTPEDGRYKIVIPEKDADVSVTVKNTLLESCVTIFKYDGATGKSLTGASFEVLKADGETVVSKAEVADNGDGSYTAVIPLESTDGKTYYIHEVRAPETNGKKYIIDEENASVKVEDLQPGQNIQYRFNGPEDPDNQYVLPNYEGFEVKLKKSADKDYVDSLTAKEAELTYTLEPDAENNFALDTFKLNDPGLTAVPGNATLSTEWYDITEVIVGQCTMDKDLNGAEPDQDHAIFAAVTFVGFDGTEYKENPVDVSENNISVKPVSAGGKKIKSFYVEYSSPDLKADTGYSLGKNFKAGNTLAKAAVFKQEKPEEGVVTAVKKIINNAEVTLTYTPGDSKGKKQKTQTLTAEDDAETVVDGAKAPKIKFSKTGPDQDVPVELGDSITYRLTVKNVTGEPLDCTDPIIVDLLPQGMVVDQESEFVKVVDRPGTIAERPAVSTGYAGDSQYVNIVFDGTIGDGESVAVELTANVTNAVANYGTVMRNFAFTTSKEVGVATSDNPTGAVIRDDDGLWASELVSIATALDCSNDRAQALKTALGRQGKYGYLADWHENNWVSDNQLICVKAEYGPADGGVYRTHKTSLLYNDENDDQRRMHYKLFVNNLSPSKRTNLVVMDILPVVGDRLLNNSDRGSNWQLYFDEMGPVTVNGQECTDYTVYYYSGDASQFNADDIETLITNAKTGCPDGWSNVKPDKSKKTTAFIVAFNYDPTNAVDSSDSRTVVLEGNKRIQIEYTALADNRKEGFNDIVFTNAANDFNFGFSTFSPPSTADKARANEPLSSNLVEATMAPPTIRAGGDVWIDANGNGWQDDGDQSWYLGYDIVSKLIKDLDVEINISNQRNFSVTRTREGSFSETGTGPNYGIAHYEFDNLTAAELRDNSTDYTNWNDGTADKLIGKNPYTYHVNINYKGNTFAKTKNNVDPRGSYVPGSIPENDQKDDNFEGSAASVRTEQFFLHQTKDVFDMTKDIGYNLKRKLELTKVSRVDGKPVEGAEFTIYGPFVHDTGKDQELSDSKIAAVLTTGANGKAEKTGLQFFMEYVIVETGAVEGFGIEGALAEGTNIQKLEEGKWLLKVPGFKAAVPEDTGYVDAVTVRDPENIEVVVEKIWNDEEGAYSDRPLSIEVMLYTDEECTAEAKDADGNTVEKKILNKINSWKAKWTDLPRYKVEKDSDGNETETEIVYYAKETLPAGKELKGYNVVIARDKETSSGKQSLTITNTPQTKGVKVQKVWAGELPSLDADERIVSVTFQVQRSVDPSDENSWENVVKKVKGVATDVTIVINRDETEARSVTGLPRNVPNGNAYSYRAVEIMMTVKDKDGATHDIDISGGAIGGYKVTEIHSAQEDGSDESEEDEDEPSEDEEFDTSTITNTAVKGKLKPVKDWQDEGNRYGDRPTAIKIRIKAEGTDYFDYETIIELNAGNNWGEDLDPIEVPVMDVFGNKITYVITEILDDDKDKEAELLKKYVPTFEIETEGVEAKVTGEGVTGSTEITDGKTTTDTYTNTHKPVRTSVTASKIWNDQNNRNGERPETIEFTLFETYTDSEGNEKTEAVTEDDTGKAVTPKEVKAAEDGTWTVSWSDLAVYKKGLVGSRITYSVRETKINGIDVNQYYGYNIDENGLEVTNTPVETGLDVTKEWDDDGAEAAAAVTAATFLIQRSVDGKTWSEMKQDGKTVTLTLEREADEVTGMGSVDGLPAYDMSSKPYMYRASETSITVDGKTVEVKDGKVGFYEVTETHTHGKDESDEMAVARDQSEIRNSLITTDFSVEKQFEGDSFGISKSVKAAAVKLQRRTGKAKWEDLKNPADAGSYELTAKDDWAHTWKDLPAYDQNGNAYQYRAVEVSITVGNKTHKVSYGEDETSGTVTAYEYSSSTEVSEEDSFTTLIVNKLRTGSLEVSKIWKDANDKSRPGSVKVALASNAAGKKISLKGVKSAATLNKDNKWTDQKTWAELPVYDAAGNKIVYSLEEPEIKKYTAAYKIAVKGSKDKEGKGTKLSTEISAGQTVKASFTNTLNTSSSSSSVRTGDDTPLTALIVMFALSMAGLALVIWRRKRC